MSVRAPANTQIYISEAASEQKDKLINKLEHTCLGKEKVDELFLGITKFLSQNPFRFLTTKCIDEERKIFLTKSYSGIEPFVVSFLFSDSHSEGRWLHRIRVVDAQGNVLID